MEGVDNRQEWLNGWGQMLVDIWREKILRLKVYDTGNLYNNIVLLNFISNEESYEAEFSVPEYGLYVDRGSGRGSNHTAQPWYSPKFYASFMKLKEFIEYSYGSESLSLIKEALSES